MSELLTELRIWLLYGRDSALLSGRPGSSGALYSSGASELGASEVMLALSWGGSSLGMDRIFGLVECWASAQLSAGIRVVYSITAYLHLRTDDSHLTWA